MIPGGPVGTLFLDAGGVLVEPDWEGVAAILAERGIAADPAALGEADPRARRRLDTPPSVRDSDDRGRGRTHLSLVLEEAGVRAPEPVLEEACGAVAEAHASRNLWCRVPRGVPEALGDLRAAGLGLVVVSNADGRIEGLFRSIGLDGRFDHVVDSGALGIEKPDPRIFREALRLCGADPASVVHAGDFYEIDVVGARSAGLRGVLIDPAGVNADRDCPRFPSLADLAAAVLAGR